MRERARGSSRSLYDNSSLTFCVSIADATQVELPASVLPFRGTSSSSSSSSSGRHAGRCLFFAPASHGVLFFAGVPSQRQTPSPWRWPEILLHPETRPQIRPIVERCPECVMISRGLMMCPRGDRGVTSRNCCSRDSDHARHVCPRAPWRAFPTQWPRQNIPAALRKIDFSLLPEEIDRGQAG